MFWNLEKIQALLTDQVEENIHLDYKAADALSLTEGKKNDIAKDVSAFANSDGGVVIYGVREFTGEKEHLPERLDPVNRQQVAKETLEQIINQRISPRIHGLLIHPIVVSDATPDDVLYVVEIPKGNTAHQASDKRYYRRYNFLSMPMEDWEIKDIINRQMRTAAEVRLVPRFTKTFELDFHPKAGKTLSFDVVARNTGIKAVMLLDCLFATKDETVARQFIPQIPYNHRTRIHESSFSNDYSPPISLGGGPSMSFRRPREPILGHTYAVIGQLDIYTDFFIDSMAIQVTVVTEDNRTNQTFNGQELIIETIGES
jgi:hypothetical protein